MTTRTVAEERLLDIVLEEALEDRPAADAHWPGLLVAVLFLCGIGVVAALLWQRPHDAPALLQEPLQEPLPAPVRASGADELGRLPSNAVNVEARFDTGAELEGLRRFRDLRRLVILNPVPPMSLQGLFASEKRDARQRFADPAAFAPLESLTTLEELELRDGMPITAAHLRFLRGLKPVALALAEVDLRSPEMIGALLTPVTLRRLRLTGCWLSRDLLSALEPLRIDQLELHACSGLDDHAWMVLCKLRTLRRLEVTNLHGGTVAFGAESLPLGTLGDKAFEAFAALPQLEHLGLDESAFPDDLLAQLPERLQSLDLGDRPMDARAARMLRRLTKLRMLTFGCGLDEDTAAAVLPSWSLERLDYRGNVWSQKLLDAIAAQPNLTEIALHVRTGESLAPLAKAARLRRLELSGQEGLTDPELRNYEEFRALIKQRGEAWASNQSGILLRQLEPLRDCKELRALRLRDSRLEARAVRDLLGDHVAIEMITTR